MLSFNGWSNSKVIKNLVDDTPYPATIFQSGPKIPTPMSKTQINKIRQDDDAIARSEIFTDIQAFNICADKASMVYGQLISQLCQKQRKSIMFSSLVSH